MTEKWLGNKKNLVTTLMVIGMAFGMVISISSYFFINHHFNLIEKEKAQITADAAEMLYIQEREVMTEIEPELNEFMSYSLKEAEKEIKALDGVTRDDLIRITKDLGVTGAWLIEEDQWVRISTDGIVRDTREQYWEDVGTSWDEVFERLLSNPGEEWIDGFTKMHIYEEYPYYKLGYRGIGEVTGLGPVVLELGLSTEDIKEDESRLREQFGLSELDENIVDIKFVRNDPSEEPNYKEGQEVMGNDHIKQYVVVEDFNDSQTQIVITTKFPFFEKLKHILLVAALLGVASAISIGGVIIYFVRKN